MIMDALLEDVKNCLDITWEDPATDKKMAGWTEAGVNYLDRKAGEKLEFNRGSEEWALLMEFVRYARDGALDVFEHNYLHLILAMQNERMIKRAAVSVETGQSNQSDV